jgi:hypothetical protein
MLSLVSRENFTQWLGEEFSVGSIAVWGVARSDVAGSKPDMRCRLFASIGTFETHFVEWGGVREGGEVFPLTRVGLEARQFLNVSTNESIAIALE